MNNTVNNTQIKKTGGLIWFFLYLTFCFAGWYGARGTAAALTESYLIKLAGNRWAIDAVAFFASGLLPVAIYYMAVGFFRAALKNTPNLCLDEMVRYLPYFCMVANLCIGGVSVIFYFYPLASVWGGIISPVFFRTIFFGAYLWFICKRYIKEYNYATFVMYFGKLYVNIAIVVLAINFLMAVIR